MRTSQEKLNPSLEKQLLKNFTRTITDFNDSGDVEKFLKDFFTESELITFTKRLAIGYWLRKKRSYTNIRNNLKVSSATIAAVQSIINLPGFVKAIKNLEAEEWANLWSGRIKKFVK